MLGWWCRGQRDQHHSWRREGGRCEWTTILIHDVSVVWSPGSPRPPGLTLSNPLPTGTRQFCGLPLCRHRQTWCKPAVSCHCSADHCLLSGKLRVWVDGGEILASRVWRDYLAGPLLPTHQHQTNLYHNIQLPPHTQPLLILSGFTALDCRSQILLK